MNVIGKINFGKERQHFMAKVKEFYSSVDFEPRGKLFWVGLNQMKTLQVSERFSFRP